MEGVGKCGRRCGGGVGGVGEVRVCGGRCGRRCRRVYGVSVEGVGRCRSVGRAQSLFIHISPHLPPHLSPHSPNISLHSFPHSPHTFPHPPHFSRTSSQPPHLLQHFPILTLSYTPYQNFSFFARFVLQSSSLH